MFFRTIFSHTKSPTECLALSWSTTKTSAPPKSLNRLGAESGTAKIVELQLRCLVKVLWKIIESRTSSGKVPNEVEETGQIDDSIHQKLGDILERNLEDKDKTVIQGLEEYFTKRLNCVNPDEIKELKREVMFGLGIHRAPPRLADILLDGYGHGTDMQVPGSDLGPWHIIQALLSYMQKRHPESHSSVEFRRILGTKLELPGMNQHLCDYITKREVGDSELFGYIRNRNRELQTWERYPIPFEEDKYTRTLEPRDLTHHTAKKIWQQFIDLLGPESIEFLTAGPPIEAWTDCFIEALYHLSDPEPLQVSLLGLPDVQGLCPKLVFVDRSTKKGKTGPGFRVSPHASGNIFAQAPPQISQALSSASD